MTEQRSLKRRVRARMAKTGERYTAARRQVLSGGSDPVAPGDTPPNPAVPTVGDPRIDAYLGKLPADQRAALGRLRACVSELVPNAVETMSYGMPAFTLHDRGLLWFAGWKAHCSVYPLPDAFLAAQAAALRGYRRTKGSLHFTPQSPLPDALLKALIRARVAEVERDAGAS